MKRRTLVKLGVAVILAGGIGLAAAQYTRLPKRLAAVEPGVLFRSAQPSTRQLGNLIEDHGIRTVMIVREGSSRRVPDEKEYAQQHGLKVVHIPILSRKPIPDEQVEEFFRYVDNPENHPILIHCSAGRHRTGYLCALYRIERQGWSVDKAVAEMLSFKFDENDQSAVLTQLRAYEPKNKTVAAAESAEPAAGADMP